MPRLKGFDYKRPYFYMVTLKALPGIAAFSKIVSAAEPPRDAKGRMKFLELYDALDHIPTRSELYHRCHEMGDLVAHGLEA